MDRYAEGCAYIEGHYCPIAEARIPITDVGFLKSDATYDVVAVWKGRFFRLEDHLDRFERSIRALHMSLPVDRDELRRILFECVRRAGLRDSYVDMIATRGVAEGGNRDPRRFSNRFYAYAVPYVWIVRPEQQEKGAHLVIAERTVRIPSHSVDPTVKNFHWADLTRGLYEAYERGGDHAVLPDSDGNLTEGPGFNIFAVKDGELFTPPDGALEGITRRTVLELAEEQGIAIRVEPLAAAWLPSADEVFATSTAGGVMPMTTLDGRPVGSGVPGPVTSLLRDRYWQAHEEERWTTPVDYGA
jgi:branched-chain amino acid aminotransferase